MIDQQSVKGRRLHDVDIADHTLILIPGTDHYYWDVEGDRVVSKSQAFPYQLKRYAPNPYGYAEANEPYYSVSRRSFGNKIIALSDLRKLNPEPKKEENMKEEKYIVGVIHKVNGSWSISPSPMPHSNLHDAKQEAARLARTDPNKKFVVLKVEGIVTMADIVWE